MTDTKDEHRRASMTRYAATFRLELTRGSAHIASMRTEGTLNAAVMGVVDGFVQQHGPDELPIFLKLLAERLDECENLAAASVVRNVKGFGLHTASWAAS